MNRISVLVAVATLTLSGGVLAQSPEETIRKVFAQQFPQAQIDHLAPSVVPGVYEVGIGSSIFYVSGDGRYVFNGKLIDLETRRDLTENYMTRARVNTLAGVAEESMIVFEPEGEAKFTITTFTDVDCGFCRKMHREIHRYSELGIRVRYMLYPRAGVNSKSYEKAVSVWCADDQLDQMTFAKNGGTPKRLTCENPVEKHMAVARQLGLQGTPMTITDSGEQIMGYVAADELLTMLQNARQ